MTILQSPRVAAVACVCMMCIGGLGEPVEVPVLNLDGHVTVTEWVVIGPFPNPLDGPATEHGFARDYLEDMGGEKHVDFSTLPPIENDQKSYEAKVVATDETGIVDFEAIFGSLDDRVAYAFTRLDSPTDQTATFFLGSDDGAKVWVNGTLVHSNNAGRGLVRGEDEFSAPLRAGTNAILVKVTELSGAWQLVLEAADARAVAEIRREQQRKENFKSFLYCNVAPKFDNPRTYSFGPGKFPDLQWERPLLVKETLGEFPLTTRWFDRDLNEVTAPAKPGRYAYYVEGTTADGMKVRRGGTMFCKPSLWEPWRERPRADLAPLAAAFINREAAAQRRDAISEFAGRMIMESIKMQGDGAVLMSYLYEMTPTEGSLSRADTPRIRDCDFHVGVKRRLLGIESKWPVLQPPQKIANPAPVLRDGTPDEAGVKPGTAAALRDICNEWYDASGEPFVLLVARHGVIVIHEAFGKDADGPLSLDAALPVASITKLLTGLLFAQFFHQGLIEIDDPVGEYLPDFPTAGDKAITLRHCFTHTSGLEGHQEWGGLHRPWMENRISNSLAHLQPGKVHLYNGMGYDLAGRVMEMVAGKSVFRLMREQMFDPLGMTESFNDEDLGFGAHVTAKDLAIFAQLLLNKGAYGDLRFFSPDVFGAMMPRPLDEFYPGLDVEWGIGLTWMRQAHPDAGRQNVPTDRTVLGQNIIGHGAATAAILRADLDHDLVIAQSRRTAGPRYNEFLTKLMMTIEENLAE